MDTSNSNNVSELNLLTAVNQAARDNASNQCMDTTAILQGQNGSNLLNMAANERLNIAVNDSVYKHSLSNRDAIERNADLNRETTDRNATAIALAVERTGTASVYATQRSQNIISSLVEHSSGEITTAQQAIAGETRKMLGEHHSTTITLAKDGVINANQNTGKVLVQASDNFGHTQVGLNAIKGKLELQAAQNVAQIQLEAIKNKSSLSAQLAECCCELKQIVISSAQTTQQVLQEIENNRIRDSLSVANTENLISRLSSSSH